MGSVLAAALDEAGGADAPREHAARLRALLLQELARGARELELARSGYDDPVTVGIGAADGRLRAVAPIDAGLRADPELDGERALRVAAALVGALVEGGGAGPLLLGVLDRWLVLEMQGGDSELAVLAFDEAVGGIDRLRAQALSLPPALLEEAQDLRAPIGAAHPLRIAEAIARLGGQPADPAAHDEHEDAVLALIGTTGAAARPHDDPDPGRRVARRILQRLAGMGKWGGYHTEFAHLARGFAGHERRLALDVGERLLAAGLLEEKPSVGQRHVFLNPRRKAEIEAFVEDGTVPRDLVLE